MTLKKINGFYHKPHPYQILSYVFFSSVLITYFLIIFPLSGNTAKAIGCTLEVVSGIVVFISGYLATTTDPSDVYLQLARKARHEKMTYNPPTREFYCGLDHTYVKESSKHCKRCNRCTEGFDHHCKWINNDVGRANYWSFFVLISSVMVFLIVYVVFGIIATVNYARDATLTNNDVYMYKNDKHRILGGLIIMWFFMILSLAFLVLDTNLVLFHIFLRFKGLTTFQYITAVEERKEHRKEMEYAMKILGKNKKTFLDFVLCLKKREPRPSRPQQTPGQEEAAKEQGIEMGQSSTPKRDKDDLSDDKKSPGKNDTKVAMEDSQECESGHKTTKINVTSKDSSSTPNHIGSSDTKEDENRVRPMLVNIESEQEKRRSKLAKEDSIKISLRDTPVVGDHSSVDMKPMGDSLQNTFKKERPTDQFDAELGKEDRKSHSKIPNARMLSYSVEKEKGDFAGKEQND